MIELFRKHKKDKPPYLERIDELPKVSIVRLKGRIDQTTIPTIDSRIEENRREGSAINKNVILDFSKVEHVDSATIAFHMIRLKEYQEKGFKVAFINVSTAFRVFIDMFRENEEFKIFASEDEAVKELNR